MVYVGTAVPYGFSAAVPGEPEGYLRAVGWRASAVTIGVRYHLSRGETKSPAVIDG